MKYHIDKVDDVQIMRVEEPRLDSTVSADFKTVFLQLEPPLNIVVDLKSVDYVDSSGLGALLFGHRHIKGQTGILRLLHLNQKVKTLIKIANLENILEGFEDEQQALASF